MFLFYPKTEFQITVNTMIFFFLPFDKMILFKCLGTVATWRRWRTSSTFVAYRGETNNKSQESTHELNLVNSPVQREAVFSERPLSAPALWNKWALGRSYRSEGLGGEGETRGRDGTGQDRMYGAARTMNSSVVTHGVPLAEFILFPDWKHLWSSDPP